MKVCHIAPLVEPLGDQPPGGAEHFARLLAESQAEAGNDVSVIATRGSKLAAGVRHLDLGIEGGQLLPIRTDLEAKSQGEREDLEEVFAVEARVFTPVKKFLSERGGEFDVVHNHAYDFFPLFSLDELNLPLLHTLHLPPLLPWVNERLRAKAEGGRHGEFFCVSATAQKLYREETGLVPGVIHCGLPLEHIEVELEPESFFLWVARISREKGLHRAIRCVAERCGAKLVAIGRVYDEKYYGEIEPMLRHPLVEYLGPLPNNEVLGWMRRARALVLPLEWNEPFGLVIIESLASGTPVITNPLGAAPEIIEHGVNGLLVEGDEGIVKALGEIDALDRRACRASVESRFSLRAMADAYDRVYQGVRARR